ncbi:MAG: hypothetical protein R3C10_27295 [Pirellulales bacterium]
MPGNAPVLGNSDVQLYVLQIRAALTDRLSIIATKDGYNQHRLGPASVTRKAGPTWRLV